MKKNARSSRKSVSAAVLAAAGVASIVMGIVTVVLEEHGISAGRLAQVAGKCGAAQASDTFIKTYRMRDRAEGYGVLSLKDGGYLLTGDTTYSSGMGVWNAFVVRTDAKGAALWSRQFGSMSAAQGVLTETKRLSVETSDGNLVVAGDIIDFYDAAYEDRKEGWGDVMVTKLDGDGNRIWSTMVGDYSMDFPQRMWAASDGGVILLAKLKEMGHGSDIADFDAVPGYSAVIKFDGKGKVQWSRKMDWVATDMEALADGGFIAVADVAAADVPMGKLPAIIRLDNTAKVLWSKSIETTPMEIPSVTGTTSDDLKIGMKQFRLSGGDFRSVKQAPDGGFIAFGRYFNAAQFIGGGASVQSLIDAIPTVAVKVNAQGKYQWARSVKTTGGTLDTDLHVAKTNDGGFVIARNVMRKAGSLKDMVSTVELVKVNANADPQWGKKIDIERNTAGYDIRPARDGGVVVSGRVVTTEQHMIMGSLEPYEEALLVKADINGNVSGAGVVTDGAQAIAGDVSSYLIMQNMTVRTEDLKLPINKSVGSDVSDIEDKQRTIVAYAHASVKPVCSSLKAGGSGAPSAAAGQDAQPQAKGWPQISFESAAEAKIETEKSRTIHAELLPILKKVYADQVKMIDNTSGLWLTYSFPRQATVADREAVQKAYEKLGYKVDESEGGHLTVSKVGLSLRMTFSINNAMKGKLEVMW
ncbi:TPA: hypothetical protein DCL30_04665 [Candidatus Peribacteria bacterium]|nr:MAG: hypothetical protein A2529_04725 [Candidatus Peribacteria bacterium RIFOXYD2_FULL_58_15]HAI98795.1 hypothetical protein [Candidatus Peribacteria bacterium]HAS34083.1 hypothetical protein [Candidatus Peribacteria bacterium]